MLNIQNQTWLIDPKVGTSLQNIQSFSGVLLPKFLPKRTLY